MLLADLPGEIGARDSHDVLAGLGWIYFMIGRHNAKRAGANLATFAVMVCPNPALRQSSAVENPGDRKSANRITHLALIRHVGQ